MAGSEIEDNQTKWLRSPVVEKNLRLVPMRDLELNPYYGPRRKIRVFRTEILIGSAEECDLRIDDPFVSPRHAELRLVGGAYIVRDLSSRNGVYLNGVQVENAPLPSQGSLRIGRSVLSWKSADDPVGWVEGEGDWIVADPNMKLLMQGLGRVAHTTLPVLLLGETGTGKDALARFLHQRGPCKAGTFVPVNGALTGGPLAESELFGHRKGAFTGADATRLGALRSAHGGTLFLDEVADIPLATQVKLLRALESGEVKALGSDVAERADFRLICATSRDLEQKIREGDFRLDLYYRIAGYVVRVPPLRERPLDVIAIARRLAEERELDLDGEAESRLVTYRWPGNVRELRASVARAAVVALAAGSGRIQAEHLADLALAPMLGGREGNCGKPLTLIEQERRMVQAALERNGWSRSAAARELGIARSSLHGKMRKFGIRDQALLTAQQGFE